MSLNFFAPVLADEDNYFAMSLEKLALTKSANKEVFNCIKKVIDKHEIKVRNGENFKLKEETVTKYEQLDTGIDKLRKRIHEP